MPAQPAQSISFNAQHAPMGAHTSFTCGHFGTAQGLAVHRGKPAGQMVLVGCQAGPRSGGRNARFLPFFADAATNDAAAFDVENQAGKPAQHLFVYGAGDIQRRYGLGSDTWETPDFVFSVYTPFDQIPDPATAGPEQMKWALIPAVWAELTIANHGSEVKTGYFGLRFADYEPGLAYLDTGLPEGVHGFAARGTIGFAGELFDQDGSHVDGAEPLQGFGPLEFGDPTLAIFRLGATGAISFAIPPGSTRTLRLALGSFLAGPVTTRLRGNYFYTRYFGSLEDVLDGALALFAEKKAHALGLDDDLAGSDLSAAQQFLVAHATHSYYGSTQLLDVGGVPHWIVNEGEYVMINTLDLSVDHVFYELRQNPWVVRNLLESFATHYSYVDEVADPVSGRRFPGGIAFTHDQGVHNQFSPKGYSSYERPGLKGCFSYMTQEQVCNWTLMAGSYLAATADLEWARQNHHLLRACLASMQVRDNPNPALRNGVMGYDSSRCAGGWEITTYDSLDHSLAQARNNLYIAVKNWASYLSLALCFEQLEDLPARNDALAAAQLAAVTVASMPTADGWIPAVFERGNPGYASRILPAVEGLVYPLFWAGCAHPGASAEWLAERGPFAAMLAALKRHTEVLLALPPGAPGANRFADGGIRLSNTSDNSWISKIAIFQHVARRLWDLEVEGADEAHVGWETTGRAAENAMCDQIVAGDARGSLYYPRCVTAWLWWE